MHPIRAISAITIFAIAAFYSTKLLGTMRLNEVMTADEQKKTGVVDLSDVQKKELESWINNKFVLKTATAAPTAQPLYLQQNIQGGTQLMFSDGSLYEIAPTDRAKATFWLTPIAVTIEPSGDPNYPSTITNTLTNVSVNGKMVKAPQPQMAPQQ
jgi:hypothetical protein